MTDALSRITLYAGDTTVLTVQFLADGQPWDLTGATVAAQARDSAESGTAALTATCTPVNEASGVWNIEWPDASAVIPPGSRCWDGEYDIEVTHTGGVHTPRRGLISATLDVTRP